MSRGVHTLSPEMLLAEAALLMQRWGHEGFPVARDGKLLGMLTRREVDRAMQHRLGNTPVRSYMRKGDFAVTPDDSVARVRHLMMEHDLGQIPVIDENERLTGIVTRTDVIRLMVAPRETARPPLADRMRAALPPDVLGLLEQASQTAGEMGFTLYLVGGLVRDLLLGIPNLDLDLVVEGDAIALAQRLAASVGGTVRKHSRFGTAKWHVPPPAAAGEGVTATGAALVLDFVTARTEFYEHPEALPTVEASSLRQDLYRRDFTINTMALRLDEQHFGQLVDFLRRREGPGAPADPRAAQPQLRGGRHAHAAGGSAGAAARLSHREAHPGADARGAGPAGPGLRRAAAARAVPDPGGGRAGEDPARLHELRILERLAWRRSRSMRAWRHASGRHGCGCPNGADGASTRMRPASPSCRRSTWRCLTYDLSRDDLESLIGRLSIVTDNSRLLRQAADLRAARR